MKRVITSVAAIAALLVISTPALAQQNRKTGIVVMSPSSVGVLLSGSDQVAIRPDFSFSKSSTDTTSVATTNSFDSWQVGAGVSALCYMGKPDAFRTYWTPRIGVNHQSANSNGANLYNASGSFGAQYGVGSRFTVFGEVGVNYAWQNAETKSTTSLGATITSTTKARSFGTRSVVGVTFSF